MIFDKFQHCLYDCMAFVSRIGGENQLIKYSSPPLRHSPNLLEMLKSVKKIYLIANVALHLGSYIFHRGLLNQSTIQPNHLQVEPRNYNGDGSKITLLLTAVAIKIQV